jgi:stress response protein YsnF
VIAGADITEEEHEVTLHAERPVVAKETVPVERVRLGKETVTQDQEVSETLRKEQIDDPDVDDNRPGAGR